VCFVLGLRCKECGERYPKSPVHVCEYCFGPLEVEYDYAEIAKVLSRKRIEDGPMSMWRYRDLLPLDDEPRAGLLAGFTPLFKAKRRAGARANRVVPQSHNRMFWNRLRRTAGD